MKKIKSWLIIEEEKKSQSNVQLIANWPANVEKPDDSGAKLQNVTNLTDKGA